MLRQNAADRMSGVDADAAQWAVVVAVPKEVRELSSRQLRPGESRRRRRPGRVLAGWSGGGPSSETRTLHYEHLAFFSRGLSWVGVYHDGHSVGSFNAVKGFSIDKDAPQKKGGIFSMRDRGTYMHRDRPQKTGTDPNLAGTYEQVAFRVSYSWSRDQL